MALFRQLDRGVRKIAAALVTCDKFRRLLDEAIELANGIARARGFDLGPNLVGLFPLIIQIFENQFVLRAEVTIERHLVGASSFGDGLDADPADAAAVEKVLRTVDNALARPRRMQLGCDAAARF